MFVKADIKSPDCHNKADEKSYGFKDYLRIRQESD